MDTLGGFAAVVALQALVEAFLRTLAPQFDRVFYIARNRCSWSDAVAHYCTPEYRTHRARVLLAETACEFISIFLAPAMLLSYAPSAFFVALGFSIQTRWPEPTPLLGGLAM